MQKFLFFIVLGLSKLLFAEDLQFDVVDQNFNSSNRIIITEEQIKKSHATSLPQLLASQANIAIVATPLQPNSIYLRGGDASHVLIIIDGVPSYDPSNVQKTLNLSHLNLKGIKKIEVIKGSQSVLYGGQALAGVIKIETFPTQIKNKTEITLQGNERSKEVNAGSLARVSDQVAVSSSVRAARLMNRSPVLDSEKFYPDQIGTVEIAALFKSHPNRDYILKLNFSDDQSEIPTTVSNFKPEDTVGFKSKTRSQGASFITQSKDHYLFALSYQSTARLFYQAPEDNGGTENDQDYRGELINVRLDYTAVNTADSHVVWGYSHTQEKMGSRINGAQQIERNGQNEGIYIKADQKLNADLLFEIGGRHEMTKLDALDNGYQLGFTWRDWVRLEHSTGFKIPSLFQKYSAGYGNPNLATERAQMNSLSFDFKKENYLTSLTFFDTQFENLIMPFGSPLVYQNVAKSRAIGAELYTSLSIESLGMNYVLALGYQEPRDISRNDWLARRPMRTASFKYIQNIADTMTTMIELNHTGSRVDKSGNTTYETLPYQTLVNAVVDWQISSVFSTFVRVDNITDQTYQNSYGYYTWGLSPKAGLQAQF